MKKLFSCRVFIVIVCCFCLQQLAQAAAFTNSYDPLNRLTNAAYSDGSREAYLYDSAGNRLSRITSAATVKVDTAPPSIPTNVVSLIFTNSQLLIGWNRAFDTGGSALAGYQIFVNGTLTATTSNTNYLLTGLLPATQYCLTVAAFDRATNISAASLPVCVITPGGSDTQPPLVLILSPMNNAVFFTNLVSVNGSITDAGRGGNGVASLTFNNIPVSGLQYHVAQRRLCTRIEVFMQESIAQKMQTQFGEKSKKYFRLFKRAVKNCLMGVTQEEGTVREESIIIFNSLSKIKESPYFQQKAMEQKAARNMVAENKYPLGAYYLRTLVKPNEI